MLSGMLGSSGGLREHGWDEAVLVVGELSWQDAFGGSFFSNRTLKKTLCQQLTKLY